MTNCGTNYSFINTNTLSDSTHYFNTSLTKMFHVKHLVARGNHKYRPSPTTQIYNAHHIKIDDTQYWSDRSYFSKLYKSMKETGIPHQDILSIWGNPYIGVVTKWGELSYQRQQNILKDYPGTDKIACNFSNAKRELAWEIRNARNNWADETKDFVSDLLIFGLSAVAEAYVGTKYPPVQAYAMPAMVNSGARIAARISPKLAKIDNKLNILYKKAEDFFNKKINTEAKPRLGTSGYKLGKYWKEQLTDSAQGLTNLGTKPKKIDDILGKIQRAKRYYRDGEIRADKYGNLYKFDRKHQTGKIHLEKIEEKAGKFWNTAEVDAETGEILKWLDNRPIGK